jgi:hypothetical protein
MEIDLRSLDTPTLRTMYEKKVSELNNALLNGAKWDDVQGQREFVVQLSKALHRSVRPAITHPAEYPFNKNDSLRP